MARCRWAGTTEWALTGLWAVQVLTGIEPEADYDLQHLGPICVHVHGRFRSRRTGPDDLVILRGLPHRSDIIRVNRFYVTRPRTTLESCSRILSYNATAKLLTRYEDKLDELVDSLEYCGRVDPADAYAIREDFARRTESLRMAQ